MRRLLLPTALLAALLAAGALAATAGAQTRPGNDPLFEPWYPRLDAPGDQVGYYQSSIAPLSSLNAPEALNFGCNYPRTALSGGRRLPVSAAGQPIADDDRRALGKIFSSARALYRATENETPGRGGAALARELALWRSGATPDDDIEISAQARQLINVTSNPYAIAINVPFGCDLGELDLAGDDLGFSTLVHKPLRWVQNLFLYLPSKIIGEAYKKIEGRAFAYSFWTPHSERGDLIFDADFNCLDNINFDTGRLEQSPWCTAQQQPLGFNADNLAPKSERTLPTWVRIAAFFQYLIGATYILILAAGALIYMSRANHRSSFTVVQMVPRLLLSIVLTIGATFLIGALITFSNYLVLTLFDESSVASLKGVREVISSIGNIGSEGIPFGEAVLQLLFIGVVTYYLFKFLVFALFRQLVLILLIALSPVAMFSLIHPRLQHHFGRWLRVLGAVLIAPFAMALVLKLGLTLNPAVDATSAGAMDEFKNGLLGPIALLITFYLMGKVQSLSVAAIRNRPLAPTFVSRLSGAASELAPAVGLANPAAGMALAGAGAALGKGAAAGAAVGGGMAKLIPDQKTRSALFGQPRAGLLDRIASSEPVAERREALLERSLTPLLEPGASGARVAAGTAGALAVASALPSPTVLREFERLHQARAARHRLQEVPSFEARQQLLRQERALREAQAAWNPAEHGGRSFDPNEWAERFWHAPAERVTRDPTSGRELAGRGEPRVVKRGVGPFAKWYVSYGWNPRARIEDEVGAPAGGLPGGNLGQIDELVESTRKAAQASEKVGEEVSSLGQEVRRATEKTGEAVAGIDRGLEGIAEEMRRTARGSSASLLPERGASAEDYAPARRRRSPREPQGSE